MAAIRYKLLGEELHKSTEKIARSLVPLSLSLAPNSLLLRMQNCFPSLMGRW